MKIADILIVDGVLKISPSSKPDEAVQKAELDTAIASIEDSILTLNSTILTARNLVASDSEGMNVVDSTTDIILTIQNDTNEAYPLNTLIPIKRNSTGNITINYESGVTGVDVQTYNPYDIIYLWKTAANTWTVLNPPKDLSNVGSGEVNTINSIVVGEPTGATQVLNIVYMTDANYQAAVTANETITGTMYIITDVPNTFYFGGTAPSALEVANLISRYDSSSIDATATLEGDPVTVWNDLVGSNHLTGQATLHIGTNKQIRFDGVDDYLQASDNTVFNFIPQTDEFSFVIKLGDIDIASVFSFLSKRTGNIEQYAFTGQSDRVSSFVGDSQNSGYNGTPQGNDVVVITVSTTTVTVRWNGVELISGSIGNSISNNEFTIGAYHNSSSVLSSFVNCDFEQLAVYDRALTLTEITAIETELIQ